MVAAITSLELPAGSRAIDAGCGFGAHLPLLLSAVGDGGAVVGLDSDEAALSTATALLGQREEIELVQGTIEELPFPDASFDLAWSSAALHHVEVLERAVGELARVTRPGGIVAVLDADVGASFPFLPLPPDLERELRAAAFRAEEDGYGGRLDYVFDGLCARRLPSVFRQAGLADVSIRAFSETVRPPLSEDDARGLCSWMLGPFAERVQPYALPATWERFEALWDAGSGDAFVHDPDFFLVRAAFLVSGRGTTSARRRASSSIGHEPRPGG